MDPLCLIEEAFASAATTRPPEPDSKCTNPFFPWDVYRPDDEAPINCDEGECAVCHFGRYCPAGTTNPNLTLTVCEANYYCPNASVKIECPPGYYCSAHSVEPIECTIGLYCPQNLTTTPNWCEKGYYCETPAEMDVCPENYYCLQGLAEPFPCPFGSTCEVGSSAPNRSLLLGITLAWLLVGLLVFMGITWVRYTASKRKAARNMEQRDHKLHEIQNFGSMLNVLQGTEQGKFKGFHRHTTPPCTITFEDLSLQVGEKVILQGVSGTFPHSSLIAIMGPSGAGKTSFLNVLTGKAYYGKVGGRACINGHSHNMKSIRHEVGFVPQDDIVNDILTVRDNISWSAWLRLPADWPNSRKTDIINDVISLLGLEHIQNSVVGSVEKRGISGGQRKRVNIGMELAADPAVLFLDEPTSGLDASTTQEILQRLRDFSRLGISTTAVIHQPRYSAFLAFDYILLLGVGGRTVYLGSSHGALSYFQSIGFACPPQENPADFFLDVISGLIPCSKKSDFVPDDLFTFWSDRTWVDRGTENAAQETARASLLEHWKDLDVNGDGKVDQEELESFLLKMGMTIDKDRVAKLFFKEAKEKALEVRRIRTVNLHPEKKNSEAEESDKPAPEGDNKPEENNNKPEGDKKPEESNNDKHPEESDKKLAESHKKSEVNDKPETVELQVLPSHTKSAQQRISSALHLKRKSKSHQPTMLVRMSKDVNPDSEPAYSSLGLDDLIELVQAPRDLTPSTEKVQIRKVPGFYRQFVLFFLRDSVRVYREATGVLANCVLQALVGTMLGGLYGGDWALYKLPEIALALATFASLFGGLLAINLISPERLLMYREAAAGTNQHAYFLNKLIINLLYCVIHTTSFLLVFYPMINFPFEYKLLWAWVFLCFFCSSGVGLLFAVLYRSPHVVVGILLTVINLFLGGALVTLSDLGSWSVLTYISPARWLAELILSYTLESLPAQWEATRNALESQFQFYYSERNIAVAALLIMGVILRVLAYAAHFLWDRSKK